MEAGVAPKAGFAALERVSAVAQPVIKRAKGSGADVAAWESVIKAGALRAKGTSTGPAPRTATQAHGTKRGQTQPRANAQEAENGFNARPSGT